MGMELAGSVAEIFGILANRIWIDIFLGKNGNWPRMTKWGRKERGGN